VLSWVCAIRFTHMWLVWECERHIDTWQYERGVTWEWCVVWETLSHSHTSHIWLNYITHELVVHMCLSHSHTLTLSHSHILPLSHSLTLTPSRANQDSTLYTNHTWMSHVTHLNISRHVVYVLMSPCMCVDVTLYMCYNTLYMSCHLVYVLMSCCICVELCIIIWVSEIHKSASVV